MALASTFAVPGRSTLAHCCAHFGIDLVDAHSAGADSFATAQLLSAYKQSSRHVQEWVRYWTEVSQLGRNFPYPHASPSGALWKPRGSTQGSNNHFLDRIADNPVEVSAEGDEVLYLDVLDKCLLDGHLTAAEQTQLVELASSMGLNRERVFELNRQYFEAIKARFWQDGTLDDTETAQLHNIAAALGLGPDVITLNRTDTKPGSIAWSAPEFALKSGDHVVLTGQMRNERPIWEKRLTAAGLIPHPRVTKKTKILVAADPNSASTKARLARTYSIPIVDEEWFERFLGLRQ